MSVQLISIPPELQDRCRHLITRHLLSTLIAFLLDGFFRLPEEKQNEILTRLDVQKRAERTRQAVVRRLL
jgi:hypothetical protein